MTEVALIQVFFLTVGSKHKKNKKQKWKHETPWHNFTIQNLALLEKDESLREFRPRFGKTKVFPRQILVYVQRFHKNGKWIMSF